MIAVGLLFSVGSASAETTIKNSVSVSSNADGSNQAIVKTIINDEVVEDWSASSTGPITYSSSHHLDSAEATVETSTRDQLLILIAQLEAIIAYYVSLLNQ